ncbi:hypothetical protein BE11_11645 [Sorangium cellulosum]|nr:hypothetical protein BE11_11645 [Sorangium cellulosum]
MGYRGAEGSLVYNGEVYNYIELREELAAAGETFSSRTDTEVLLAALHRWGPERTLSRLNWMGAFAWLDLARRRLVLACDAGSEKPLYYCAEPGRIAFASEIKAILTLMGRKFPLDRDVVGQLLLQGLSDATTRTLFQGIRRVEAGTWAQIDLDAPRLELKASPFQPLAHPGDPSRMRMADFIEELRSTFLDAVRLRLRSDVPVGVLLSGGVDSSAIAAVAQALVGRDDAPLLLSAVSNDDRFDESSYIAAMERHLRRDAHKIVLPSAPETLVAEISEANWFNDAPIASLSALAHRRLMKRAKELGITVVLSGQGADESLLGYRKYLGFYLQSLARRGRFLEAACVLAGFIANRTVVTDFDLGHARRYLPFLRRRGGGGAGGAPRAIEGPWLRGWEARPLGLGDGTLADRQWDDIRHHSVPSLCHYEDRMSMSWGREIRLPFLDFRLVDLLLRAPDSYKLRRGWTKYAFRKAMARYLPPEVCWRKDKKCFSNPEGEWLKGELREAVEDAFSPGSLMCRAGIVRSDALLAMYDRYRRQPPGGAIWHRAIFAPLSLELWMRRHEGWIA